MKRRLLWLLSVFGVLAMVSSCGMIPKVNEAFLIGVTPQDEFQQSGEVRFSILPKDDEGSAIIQSGIQVDVKLAESLRDRYQVQLQKKQTNQPKAGQNLATLLNIDSSGSMRRNDPKDLRKEAAKQFIDQLGSDDTVAVADFGAGDTDPFEHTRLLQDFTQDKDKAKEAIDKITARGGTPMFRSLLEVTDYFQQKFSGDQFNRALIVLGDGTASDKSRLDDFCEKAKATGIPVSTIGFGPAADNSKEADNDAVKLLRQVANCSGGTYTAVADASQLQNAFRNVGASSKLGNVEVIVQYSPIPDSGTTINGTLQISNGAQAQPVTLQYTFVAP